MSEEEKNNFENDKTDHETDSSTENDIQTELENDFAKNLFPLIHEYKQKLSCLLYTSPSPRDRG